MSTLVLVTPVANADGSADRFTPGHLRELAERFDRVVVVLDHSPNGATPAVPGRSSAAVDRTDAPLESVLDSLAANGDGPGAAVIIDGDIRSVRRAGTVAKQHDVPALWWCDGPPADEIQRDTLNFIDAVLAPVDETSVGPYLAIGAGIDTRSLRAVPLPPQPPLRILVLGRAVDQGGLAIPLRALAEARASGVDAHLLIVDSLRISTRSARRLAESLVADLMLTQSVELLDADQPVSLPDVLQRIHAVIDAGAGSDVDHLVLEAMACGRPVISSRASLTPIIANESLPLVFGTGDPQSLASCICALAAARTDELAAIGARLRMRVDRLHSLPRWGASIAAIVEALQPR